MRVCRVSLAAVFFVLVGCAEPQKPKVKAAPPPDPIATSEKLAFEAERQINAAEAELSALHPDVAVEHLDLSEKLLSDPQVDRYPDAERLRERHTELVARVPAVREEVRKRELAAAVAAAKQKIEAARGAMRDALAELKKRDPADADLKKAAESVVAVRTTLDEAADLESKDSEYSKYSISVRKDIADKRRAVEQRELEVLVDRGREEIGHAFGELAATMKRVQLRDVVDADFSAARAAADETQKAIGKSDALGGRDAKFGKYLTEVKTKLESQKTAIDKRAHEVSVDRQKKKVEESKKALADALKRIERRDVVEAELVEAETAASTAAASLKDGIGLAAKDKDYAKYAADSQKKIDESNARILARRLEVKIEKQKMEIENAKATLADAQKALSAPQPVDGDFEAAKNAIVLVEKSLDAAEALTAKDRNFAKWVLDSRRSLQGGRQVIEKRKLEVEIAQHRREVTGALAAMRASLETMTTQESVAAAEKSVAALEKVLDAGDKYGAKDAAYSRFAIDTRKATVAAHKNIREKSELIAMELQKTKVDVQIEAVKGALAGLEGFSVSEEQFKAANDAIAGAKKALEEGGELERKLARYNGWAVAKRRWIESSEEKVAKRKTAIALRERRLLIEQAFDAAKLSGEAAKGREATSATVNDALAAVKSAREEAEKAAELARRDKTFATFVTATKSKLEKLQTSLEALRGTVAFRSGPVSALAEGMKLAEGAEAKTPEVQQKAYAAALEQFQTCKKDGAAILADHPKLAGETFGIAKKKMKAPAVLSMCGERAKNAESKLAALTASLAFIEGPARSFTKGKALLDEAQKAAAPEAKKKVWGEALSNFEECVEKGKVLQHQHPELNKAKFDIDGQVLTLPFVLSTCQNEAKTLRVSYAGGT